MILRRLVALLRGNTDRSCVRAAASAHAADVRLSNHLLNAYTKSGSLALAEMPHRNLVSWSALISGHDQARRPDLALELFARMDAQPNEYVYASVLRALDVGTQVHADAVKSRFLGVSFVANSVVSMYMKCGCVDEGYGVFRTLVEPNFVSYNAVISGLAESSQLERGLEVFRLIKLRGLRPD